MKIIITIDIGEELRAEMLQRLQTLVCDLRAQGFEVSARLDGQAIYFFCDQQPDENQDN